MDTESHITKCGGCGTKLEILCSIIEGHATREEIECPVCNADLGRVRCDAGMPTILIFTSQTKNNH